MPQKTVNPTRMELSKLKKKLFTAQKGHKLLKDKHDGLMRQFLDLKDEAVSLRNKVEKALNLSQNYFLEAQSTMQEGAVFSALMTNKKNIEISINEKNIMGVKIPVFAIDDDFFENSASLPYGFYFTSWELDEAQKEFGKIIFDLIKMSELEKACILMADEIEKTRRRVNALEHVLIPSYKETIRYIRLHLEENERSTITRLLKIKDMIIEENLNKN